MDHLQQSIEDFCRKIRGVTLSEDETADCVVPRWFVEIYQASPLLKQLVANAKRAAMTSIKSAPNQMPKKPVLWPMYVYVNGRTFAWSDAQGSYLPFEAPSTAVSNGCWDKPLEGAIGSAAAGTASGAKPKAGVQGRSPAPERKSDEGLRRAIARAQSPFNPISLLS